MHEKKCAKALRGAWQAEFTSFLKDMSLAIVAVTVVLPPFVPLGGFGSTFLGGFPLPLVPSSVPAPVLSLSAPVVV